MICRIHKRLWIPRIHDEHVALYFRTETLINARLNLSANGIKLQKRIKVK